MTVKPWKHLCVVSYDDLVQTYLKQITAMENKDRRKKRSVCFDDLTNFKSIHRPDCNKLLRTHDDNLHILCPSLFEGNNVVGFNTISTLWERGPLFKAVIAELRLAVLILKVFSNRNIQFYFPYSTLSYNASGEAVVPTISDHMKCLSLITNGDISELNQCGNDGLLMIMMFINYSYSFPYKDSNLSFMFRCFPKGVADFIEKLTPMKSWFEEQLDFFIKHIDAKTVSIIPEIYGYGNVYNHSKLIKLQNVIVFNNEIVLRIHRGADSETIRDLCEQIGINVKTVYTLHLKEMSVDEYS